MLESWPPGPRCDGEVDPGPRDRLAGALLGDLAVDQNAPRQGDV